MFVTERINSAYDHSDIKKSSDVSEDWEPINLNIDNTITCVINQSNNTLENTSDHYYSQRIRNPPEWFIEVHVPLKCCYVFFLLMYWFKWGGISYICCGYSVWLCLNMIKNGQQMSKLDI